jgi:cell division protein FtsW
MSPRQLRQLLLVVILSLLGLGVVAVYSSSSMGATATYGNSAKFLGHHLAAIACGGLLAVGCLMIPYEQLRIHSRWMFAVAVVLLVLVAVFGQEISGAKRWFRIGRWSVQPSEFAQISLVFYLADMLARHAGKMHDLRRGLLPPLVATGVMAVFVLIQPDLGTTIVMGAVALLLLAVAKANPRHLLIVISVGLVVLGVLVAGEEYRRRRILAFLDPWADPRGSGYQILQSYFAMASGGLTGLGVGASLQRLFFLPSAHTDFIFAIIGEELGLAGTTAVLVLFGLFLTCGFRIALAAQDLFSKYLVCGLVGMIGLEAMINIAVVTGMMPTKGLPLPFISYGGSSMVMNLIACAFIFQASRYGERLLKNPVAG